MLAGSSKQNHLKILNSQNGSLASPPEIVNPFVQHCFDYSSDHNFSSTFITEKTSILNTDYSRKRLNPIASEIEQSISSVEFDSVLAKMTGKTPGFDRLAFNF